MQVELLRDGAPECPLVRFFSADWAEFARLRRLADLLATREQLSCSIGAAGGYVLLGIEQLSLNNLAGGGMTEEVPGRPVWSLAASEWEAVSALLEPLAEPSILGGFQWLDEAGRGFGTGLAVLASVSETGDW